MRKAFDGLLVLAVEHVGRDPLAGGLFVFVNRRRDRRLEVGSLQMPAVKADARSVTLTATELTLLLRRLYMPRSERLADPNQKVLFELGGQEAGAVAGVSAASPAADPPAAAASAAPPKRQGHGRRRAAAVLFTLLSSAKRHGLNTWAYLRDVLWRLADLGPGELAELLPDRWKDSRAG